MSAHRRMLDLLGGWMIYVAQCADSEEPHPGVTKEQYETEHDAIYALYQKYGSFEDMSLDAVRRALLFDVLSLVADGPGPTGSPSGGVGSEE